MSIWCCFIRARLKIIIILGIRKSIIMMNIQFNRARKLAHYGEKKENIQIKRYLIQDHQSLVVFPPECSHMELIPVLRLCFPDNCLYINIVTSSHTRNAGQHETSHVWVLADPHNEMSISPLSSLLSHV